MTRWTTICLAGLGTYGLAMAVTGLALAVSSTDPASAGTTDGSGVAALAPADPVNPANPLDPVNPAEPVDPGLAAALPALPVSPSVAVPSSRLTTPPSVEPLAGARRPPATATGRSSVPAARQASAGPDQTTSFLPLELTLPNGATAPIKAADVAEDGSLTIPDNPRVVGLWTDGAQPGERFGSVVIAGHVDSARYGIGVLAGLKGVKAGEVIELSAGRSVQRYRVVKSVMIRQQSLASDAGLFAQDGPPRLVVITCGGPFDPVRHRYRDNFIVTATPIA